MVPETSDPDALKEAVLNTVQTCGQHGVMYVVDSGPCKGWCLECWRWCLEQDPSKLNLIVPPRQCSRK